jgi:hypothetical protein
VAPRHIEAALDKEWQNPHDREVATQALAAKSRFTLDTDGHSEFTHRILKIFHRGEDDLAIVTSSTDSECFACHTSVHAVHLHHGHVTAVSSLGGMGNYGNSPRKNDIRLILVRGDWVLVTYDSDAHGGSYESFQRFFVRSAASVATAARDPGYTHLASVQYAGDNLGQYGSSDPEIMAWHATIKILKSGDLRATYTVTKHGVNKPRHIPTQTFKRLSNGRWQHLSELNFPPAFVSDHELHFHIWDENPVSD